MRTVRTVITVHTWPHGPLLRARSIRTGPPRTHFGSFRRRVCGPNLALTSLAAADCPPGRCRQLGWPAAGPFGRPFARSFARPSVRLCVRLAVRGKYGGAPELRRPSSMSPEQLAPAAELQSARAVQWTRKSSGAPVAPAQPTGASGAPRRRHSLGPDLRAGLKGGLHVLARARRRVACGRAYPTSWRHVGTGVAPTGSVAGSICRLAGWF